MPTPGPFGSRAAYDWAVEMSIYLREDQRHRGTGKQLYAALEAVLRAQNIQNLYACIGCPDGADDAHLTRNSAQFHAHLGYRLVGEFPRCGYKFGTWYSMVWMEKCIGAHEAQPAPVRPFPEISRRSWKPFWTVHKAAGRFRSGNGPCFFLSLLQQFIRAQQHLRRLGAREGRRTVAAGRIHAAGCQT